MRARAERKQMGAQRRLAGQIKTAPRRRPDCLPQAALADPLHLQPRPARRSLNNVLARNTQSVGKHSAQALVAPHHIAKRSFQSSVVESPLQAQRNRHVVGRATPLQAVEEPQPGLEVHRAFPARSFCLDPLDDVIGPRPAPAGGPHRGWLCRALSARSTWCGTTRQRNSAPSPQAPQGWGHRERGSVP